MFFYSFPPFPVGDLNYANSDHTWKTATRVWKSLFCLKFISYDVDPKVQIIKVIRNRCDSGFQVGFSSTWLETHL